MPLCLNFIAMSHPRKISSLVSNLLDWFAQNARDLPWRRTQDPYAIWVSEIMKRKTLIVKIIGRVKFKLSCLDLIVIKEQFWGNIIKVGAPCILP
jgi:hypothetical protein